MTHNIFLFAEFMYQKCMSHDIFLFVELVYQYEYMPVMYVYLWNLFMY